MDSETTRLLITTLATLSGAFVGAFVPSLFNYLSNRGTRKAADRREYQEMVVRLAVENWKQSADLYMKAGVKGTLSPLDVFMVHMARTADVIFDPTTNGTNLEERLKKVDDIVDIMTDRADRLTKESRQKTKPTM